MRRLFVILALVAPALLLLFFRLWPEADPAYPLPLFHFYIVSFTAFAAAVVSFLLSLGLEDIGRPRHALAALAFGVMGSVFAIHGLTTPGAILPGSHPSVPAVGWSAWLTLFSGGVIFLLASLDRPGRSLRPWLSRIIGGAVAAVLLYLAVVLFVPHWLTAIEEKVTPWHQLALFIASFLIWVVAGYRLWQTFRQSESEVDQSLALVAAWLALATISMHRFPLWQLSWWLYHVILLVAFLYTGYVLFAAYEQLRRFRLLRYYLAAALIQTALLALVASYLFSQAATMAAAPQAEVLQARSTGLGIAAVTMGLLSVGLSVVVQRGERIIEARTEELAVAYRELRQAEEMRDDLTHMIIHDLRTPLTTIAASLGLLQTVSAESLNDVQTRVVARGRRATQRLDRMIDDILTVGKIETGELQPQRRRINLHGLLAERLEPFTLQAEAEGKVLAFSCPLDLEATVDPLLAGRVVENLVNNAFKYTGSGGHIAVSAARANGELLLQVQDNGAGVPDDYKEHIFRKFGQVPDEEGGKVRKGSGLGLAFCRLVAEAHGGRIWVEDAPGGGSEFKVLFHD